MSWERPPCAFGGSSESRPNPWPGSISLWKKRPAHPWKRSRRALRESSSSWLPTLRERSKLYQQAVELDPNLALMHGRMGAAYLFLVTLSCRRLRTRGAYQLRDRLTEKDRLNTEIAYYGRVTGDWEKNILPCFVFLEIFFLGMCSPCQPQGCICVSRPAQERAADEAAETARLQPSSYYFGSAIQSIRFASRFNEAKSWLAKAEPLKLDIHLSGGKD